MEHRACKPPTLLRWGNYKTSLDELFRLIGGDLRKPLNHTAEMRLATNERQLLKRDLKSLLSLDGLDLVQQSHIVRFAAAHAPFGCSHIGVDVRPHARLKLIESDDDDRTRHIPKRIPQFAQRGSDNLTKTLKRIGFIVTRARHDHRRSSRQAQHQ
ncbi:MAG: hypothetical protein OXD34_07150 [bacterium]|nr:hypothetical protein [bacterium]